MLQLLVGAAALLRQWKLAAALLALAFTALSHQAKLRAERALETCRGEARMAKLRLERADLAAEALRRDSRRRAIAQERLLAEAHRANEIEAERIERLRRSAMTTRPGDGCEVSDSLRQSEKNL